MNVDVTDRPVLHGHRTSGLSQTALRRHVQKTERGRLRAAGPYCITLETVYLPCVPTVNCSPIPHTSPANSIKQLPHLSNRSKWTSACCKHNVTFEQAYDSTEGSRSDDHVSSDDRGQILSSMRHDLLKSTASMKYYEQSAKWSTRRAPT